MNIKKYEKLRKKIIERDFEKKYKNLDRWLFGSSFFGNVGSIFFAYFLVFPALNKAISTNLTTENWGVGLGIFSTLVILTLFEYIKRIVLTNFSFDIVKKEFAQSILWLVFSLGIIIASAWFSIKGAINFSSTTDKYVAVLDSSYQVKIDSTIALYDEMINPYTDENKKLREVNDELRNKLLETPLNYVNTRKGYNDIINDNLSTIKKYEDNIKDVESKRDWVLKTYQEEKNTKILEYKENVTSDQTLFFIIAFSIEIIIIIGIYFRQHYDYHIYIIHQRDLEDSYRKLNNYKIMLNFLYKNGETKIGDKILPAVKLKEILKENTNVGNPNNFVETFLNDILYMGIVRLEGKRRFIAMNYDEAIKRIENFDNTLKILENLK
jgi:hypothetical protein